MKRVAEALEPIVPPVVQLCHALCTAQQESTGETHLLIVRPRPPLFFLIMWRGQSLSQPQAKVNILFTARPFPIPLSMYVLSQQTQTWADRKGTNGKRILSP